MPANTTTLSSTSTASAGVVFTDETLRKTAALVADAYRPVWTGASGEESSGEAVARHLEATAALLDKDGWIRAYDYSSDWTKGIEAGDEDSMTVKDMLKSLLRMARDSVGTDPRRTLRTALRHVGEGSPHGDTDTDTVASEVLDLLIKAHTGSCDARAVPWSERLHRTHADINALLAAGARFARTYGARFARTYGPTAPSC
ncbi:hypothetical protein RFN57_03575 [Streptomyces violaceochromogenes]|uniref:Uncharacterized protein n=1 Tax=Streptomyces violaceochromogenes TaxID=67377 RepID=A0ABU6LT96_9ACTN|nr:hypothetical protein [Streptomyces violaceochromogenes]MEC7051386.1 hypothetical protein [Streptomyces violaceochromogenes]GHC94163.1 hypothetical protein GCM10010309_79220 [Streptomyces violaceochromogenes]